MVINSFITQTYSITLMYYETIILCTGLSTSADRVTNFNEYTLELILKITQKVQQQGKHPEDPQQYLWSEKVGECGIDI